MSRVWSSVLFRNVNARRNGKFCAALFLPALLLLILTACEAGPVSETEVDNIDEYNMTDLFDNTKNYFSDEENSINKEGLEVTENFDGIKIAASVEALAADRKIHIRGVYRTFVRCGSQRAIWQGFSSHFNYMVKDLLTEKVYATQFSPLSISHAPMPAGPDGEPMPDSYSQMPCDQFDKRYFEVELYNEMPDLARDIDKLEVSVKIDNLESNRILVDLSGG